MPGTGTPLGRGEGFIINSSPLRGEDKVRRD